MKSVSWQEFRQKAAASPRRIVLPDGLDARVVQAAVRLAAEHIAHPVLVGPTAQVESLWKKWGGRPSDLKCLDSSRFSANEKENWSQELLKNRRFKSLSSSEAQTRLEDSLILGALALKQHEVDGFVGGAARTTTDTLRALFPIIGMAPEAGTLFGFFFLESHSAGSAAPRTVLLADCAVVPDPSPRQLSQFAIGAAAAWRYYMTGDPKVAFLSFSTAGSAEHESLLKIREAFRMTREKAPDLLCEGEWQADAALDRWTAEIKGVGRSSVAGGANILIVPDLNCGNIAYKLVQRLGGCRAVGPILWGLAQPASDLSRGCSVEDVVDAAALIVLQAQTATKEEITR